METGSPTHDLLIRWHSGDARALDELLRLHLPWIRDQVHRRLGQALREKADTGDIVQDTMLQFLRYGPRFVITGEPQFRALLVRMIENVLRDKHDFFEALRRQSNREQPIPSDTVLSLDPPRSHVDTPSVQMQRKEDEAWVRLGLAVLNPEERNLILQRDWDRLSFKEIAESLQTSESAAQMRYYRAVARLSFELSSLRRGQLERVMSNGNGT